MESVSPGSPVFAPRALDRPAVPTRDLDAAVGLIAAAAPRWVSLPMDERIGLLDRLLADCATVAPEWLEASARGKGVTADPDAVGQEWISGPYVVIRYLRRLRDSLRQIREGGAPRVPGPTRTRSDGRLIVGVLPQTVYDRLFFSGVSAQVVMAPGVGPAEIEQTMAPFYRDQAPGPTTAVVLGAGNVSGMAPIDALYKLFVEGRTVVLKMNPLNSYMTDTISQGLKVLLDQGFLQVVQGGPPEGQHLCDHPDIGEIHVTGSDKTYEAVMYGSDEHAGERKAAGVPLRVKRVTAELGGVGPAIAVPGRWTPREIVRGAEMVATIAFDGGGFSCGAIDLLILHAEWPQREEFIEALREVLRRMPLRPAYYPGTRQRYQSFVDAHEHVEVFGSPDETHLPWTLIRGLDDQRSDDICFTREPFCSVCADTSLSAADAQTFVAKAAEFVNEVVWGSLGCTLFVPAAVASTPETAGAVERAITTLRYGTIGVNYHPSAAWVSGVTPWGGFQSPEIDPSQSGVGFTQNALMLRHTEKTVLRAPLVGRSPAPVWLTGRGQAACRTFDRLCRFEASPSPRQVPGIVRAGLGI